MRWRYFRQSLFFGVVRLSALIITLALLGIIAFLLVNGFRAVTWDFLTLPPDRFHDEGRDHAGHRRHLLSDRRGDRRSPCPWGWSRRSI